MSSLSLDVLTTGREYTGGTTVFLTIKKHAEDEDVVASYAITGLGEMAARLCTDQKLKLAKTRAVFTRRMDGISSLLLALNEAGAPEVHIIQTEECGDLERLADIILGPHRAFPRIQSCVLRGEAVGWWMVFKDEHLIVHAQRAGSSATFLYTSVKNRFTLAVLPPERTDTLSLLSHLPVIDECSISVDAILDLKHGSNGPIGSCPILTIADVSENNNEPWDEGILVRSQHQLRRLRSELPSGFPLSKFPFEPFNNPIPKPLELTVDQKYELQSCTSISVVRTGRTGCPFKMAFADRRPAAWKKSQESSIVTSVEDLKSILSSLPKKENNCLDENEIDLESVQSEVEAEIDTRYAHILVLGTGCASPSPLRGSSGYALLIPHDDSLALSVVVECGEGFMTSLTRFLPRNKPLHHYLLQIQLIWISHAHLDHYGGLPGLLRAIHKAKCSTQKPRAAKRHKTDAPNVSLPLVIAPRKVLAWLDLHMEPGTDLYKGITHEDYGCSPFQQTLSATLNRRGRDGSIRAYRPFLQLKNVRVNHSCSAYGLILELAACLSGNADGTNPFVFCYSGDTRPSQDLVQECRGRRVALLLHEATFDDNDREQALERKHSTVSEALDIATAIQADMVLLTHFSQRYAQRALEVPSGNPAKSVAMAQDGLFLPLK